MAALYYNDKKVDDNLTYVKIEGEFEANNQSKTIDITENGETTVTYDEGYTGLESVTINTHIQGGGGGGLDFTQIGYEGTPESLQTTFDYAKQIYDNWDPSVAYRYKAFSGDTQLVYFPAVDTSNVTTMGYMFRDCANLQIVPHLDTTNVTAMNYMFDGCNNLQKVDIANWDLSNVTTINNLFAYCSKLESLDLSGWNMPKHMTVEQLFAYCGNLKSIIFPEYFRPLTSLAGMFRSCSGLTSIDLSSFDTSKVTNMNIVFENCPKLTSITFGENFDTSNVTNMKAMFYYCSGLTSLDLSGWDTSKVTNMANMFAGCSGLTSLDISGWDTSKVTTFYESIYGMFYQCRSLEKVDGYLDYSLATTNGYSANYTFEYCLKLRKFEVRNLGSVNKNSAFYFAGNSSGMYLWGENSEEIPDARQSLINTLITYSFDRVAAGYTTPCTIYLHATTKARLTEDEIAQITSKGYTIA